MTEQFTAADFERELADVAADYHPTARHIEVVLAALRIAQRVMADGVIEEIAKIISPSSFFMTPQHYGLETQDEFKRTWAWGEQQVARERATAVRTALTREET